jgi:hypothetical protein
VQAVYHAIGYHPAEVAGIAYDEKRTLLANNDGRIVTSAENGEVRERLYATGWAKRGPVGLIGSTKSDALLIVDRMLEDLAKSGLIAEDRNEKSIDELLKSRGVKAIDYAGWKRVDEYEREAGAKEQRARKKVVSSADLVAIALDC